MKVQLVGNLARNPFIHISRKVAEAKEAIMNGLRSMVSWFKHIDITPTVRLPRVSLPSGMTLPFASLKAMARRPVSLARASSSTAKPGPATAKRPSKVARITVARVQVSLKSVFARPSMPRLFSKISLPGFRGVNPHSLSLGLRAMGSAALRPAHWLASTFKGVSARVRNTARMVKGAVVTRKYYIYEKDLNRELEPGASASIHMEFRSLSTATEANKLPLQGLGYTEERKAQARERLAMGDLCFIGIHKGSVVMAGWVSFRHLEIPAIASHTLGDGWANLYEIDSVSGYREQGYVREFQLNLMTHLKKIGVGKVVTCIPAGEPARTQDVTEGEFIQIGKAVWRLYFNRWLRVSTPTWLAKYLQQPARLPQPIEPRERARSRT